MFRVSLVETGPSLRLENSVVQHIAVLQLLCDLAYVSQMTDTSSILVFIFGAALNVCFEPILCHSYVRLA